MIDCEFCNGIGTVKHFGGLGYIVCKCITDQMQRLKAENHRLREALEHIADKASVRNCCKFAALSSYRRRHLKEIARAALEPSSD